MPDQGNIPIPRGDQDSIPTFSMDEAEVQDAYRAYTALRMAAADQPSLTLNPYFLALQDTAYAQFHMLFEALQ